MEHATNRNLHIHSEIIPPAEFLSRLDRDPVVICLPSRKDTFNLVALEALLSGCPAIVSTKCGACDFLDEVYPGLPYVKIDPNNILGSYDSVVDLLENYSERKIELIRYLTKVTPKNWGSSLAEVYGQSSTSDAQAVDALASSFGEYRKAINNFFHA
ncbi:MAG: hypothetical protein IPP88_22415 [Betaproteobacteria bacterium]|nr:hypothetical protein [Betaproteobacteria bacterium]